MTTYGSSTHGAVQPSARKWSPTCSRSLTTMNPTSRATPIASEAAVRQRPDADVATGGAALGIEAPARRGPLRLLEDVERRQRARARREGLAILEHAVDEVPGGARQRIVARLHVDRARPLVADRHDRSEEHTSELQSQSNLVCRLLL